MKNKISYTANTSEAGVQTEIYLPKKSYFQGTLYDTLTKGFDHKHVVNTLISNISEIKQIMDKFTIPRISKGLDRERIKKMKQIFWGYSMYEVDGIFFSKSINKRRIAEERSQVIRIMFLPDINYIREKLIEKKDIEVSREEIKNIIDTLFHDNLKVGRKSKEKKQTFLYIQSYIEDWRWDIQLFLFGYVIDEICKQTNKLCKDIKPENEIWISSFWNTQISRIVLNQDL